MKKEIQGSWELFLSGLDVPVKQNNIIIKQPKIKDIVAFGENKFFNACQLIGNTGMFIKDIKKGNPQLNALPDFQILLVMMQDQEEIKQNILNFLEFICPDYDIKISDTEINFKIDNQIKGQINPFYFDNFQSTVKELFIPLHGSEEEFNPIGEKSAAIAEKLKKGREKIAKMRGEETKNNSIFGLQTSILSVGLGLDINILYNYTPFQLYDSFNRYTMKLQSDYYQKVASTPFMDVSKIDPPDDWMSHVYG